MKFHVPTVNFIAKRGLKGQRAKFQRPPIIGNPQKKIVPVPMPIPKYAPMTMELEDGSFFSSINIEPESKVQDELKLPIMKTRRTVSKTSEEDIKKIQELRNADPITNSACKLAKEFNCSPLFISTIAPLKNNKEAIEKLKMHRSQKSVIEGIIDSIKGPRNFEYDKACNDLKKTRKYLNHYANAAIGSRLHGDF